MEGSELKGVLENGLFSQVLSCGYAFMLVISGIYLLHNFPQPMSFAENAHLVAGTSVTKIFNGYCFFRGKKI